MSNPAYKLLASRYICLCSQIANPIEKCNVSQLVAEKVNKVGKIFDAWTGEQKDIITAFRPKKGSLTRVCINGHFGAGKSVLLALGMRKLFDEIPVNKEKHIIIYTSLGFIQGSNGKTWNSAFPKDQFTREIKGDLFLSEIKHFCKDWIESKPNIKILIDNFENIMATLNISILCDKCRASKHNNCNHIEKKIFKVDDIDRMLIAAKAKFPGIPSLGNVHIYLDEVRHCDQDWSVLNSKSNSKKNVIWLALSSEHYTENEQIFKFI